MSTVPCAGVSGKTETPTYCVSAYSPADRDWQPLITLPAVNPDHAIGQTRQRRLVPDAVVLVAREVDVIPKEGGAA